MSRRSTVFVVLVVVLFVGAAIFLGLRETPAAPKTLGQPATPAVPVATPAATQAAAVAPSPVAVQAPAPSATAAVLTPQQRLVVEAVQTGTHPERLTDLQKPPVFDAAAYAADPDGYCQQVVPSRIWQSAQGGKDVPALGEAAPLTAELPAGGKFTCAVKAPVGSPVTFHAFDSGRFTASGLATITVRTPADGIAKAAWEASAGVSHDVHLLASCPLASGRVEFLLTVVSSESVK